MLRSIQAWLADGTEVTVQRDIPTDNDLPGGVPTQTEYIRTQLIYADEVAEVVSFGANAAPAEPGEYIRMGNIQRFRLLPE